MTALTTSRADVLEVISNLSNDFVFTRPRVTNEVLDLLPPHVWTDPELRWLDPGAKSGVFLREVARRLHISLEHVIGDPEERLAHILRNMVFGISLTELTAMMSRRSLYCSKDAAGPRSVVPMDTSAGHVWFDRVEHTYVDGRCRECGGARSELEKSKRHRTLTPTALSTRPPERS